MFRYNQPEGLISLDPAFAKSQPIMWATHQLFNTLIEVNDSLKLVGGLAYKWEISKDGKTYQFWLRDSVFFHDDPVFALGKGRKMTAHDVVYSLSRIVDKKTASPGAWIFNNRVDSTQPFKIQVRVLGSSITE